MCPLTEADDARQSEFAAEVLRKLLRRIDAENQVPKPAAGRYAFLVSHAWTNGPMMYLVYKSPPSDISWGLARDTRESIIDPAPWQTWMRRRRTTTSSIWRKAAGHLSVRANQTRSCGAAFHSKKVFPSGRPIFPTSIGTRHHRERHRRSASKITP